MSTLFVASLGSSKTVDTVAARGGEEPTACCKLEGLQWIFQATLMSFESEMTKANTEDVFGFSPPSYSTALFLYSRQALEILSNPTRANHFLPSLTIWPRYASSLDR